MYWTGMTNFICIMNPNFDFCYCRTKEVLKSRTDCHLDKVFILLWVNAVKGSHDAMRMIFSLFQTDGDVILWFQLLHFHSRNERQETNSKFPVVKKEKKHKMVSFFLFHVTFRSERLHNCRLWSVWEKKGCINWDVEQTNCLVNESKWDVDLI